MKLSKRSSNLAKEGENSWEEIKERDHDFEQNEYDPAYFIDDVNLLGDFTNDPTDEISSEEKNLKEKLDRKKDYENKLQDHKEDKLKWEQQELESLQEGYLNYYDTVRISIIDYEHVSTN